MRGGGRTENQTLLQYSASVELEVHLLQTQRAGTGVQRCVIAATDGWVPGAGAGDSRTQGKPHGHGPISGLPRRTQTGIHVHTAIWG